MIAALATVYTLFLIYAAGFDKLLLSFSCPSLVVHLARAGRRPVFQGATRAGPDHLPAPEAVLFGVIVLGAVAGVVSLATGAISI